jgi:hypothetical protein
MTDNFFLDNSDLQFRLERLELQDVIDLKEKGYQYSKEYPAAPRHAAGGAGRDMRQGDCPTGS